MVRTKLFTASFLVSVLIHLAMPASSDEIVLRLAGRQAPGKEQQWMTRALRDFELRNPDIKVNLEILVFPGIDEITKGLTDGTSQDVLLLDTLLARELMKANLLLLLNNYLGRGAGMIKNFVPALAGGAVSNSEVYGIPWSFSTLVLYYNRTIFDSAGLDPPNSGWKWEDLRSASKKLTDLAKGLYGISMYQGVPTLVSFIYQAGGSLLDAKGKPVLPVKQAARAVAGAGR